jgi:hypothetical protein
MAPLDLTPDRDQSNKSPDSLSEGAVVGIIMDFCSEIPADQVDLVMDFLLDWGVEEELAERVLVELYAA